MTGAFAARLIRAGGERLAAMSAAATRLVGVPEIRRFFRTSQAPVCFVSATAFNLLGMDRWVRGFRYVNYYDSFDGTHPSAFVPHELAKRPFESIEEINNYLLATRRSPTTCARSARIRWQCS